MVFNLIEEQVFGKQESDKKEDFSEVFDFEASLIIPFLPKSRAAAPQQARRSQRVVS